MKTPFQAPVANRVGSIELQRGGIILVVLLAIAALASDADGVEHGNDQVRETPKGQQFDQPRLDLYGDLLPPGAVVRIGTVRLRCPGGVRCVRFSPDGTQVAAGCVDSTIRIFSVKTGEIVTTLRGHKEFIISLAYHKNGKRLLSIGYDQTMRLWDVVASKQVWETRLYRQGPIGSLAASSEGDVVAWREDDQAIRIERPFEDQAVVRMQAPIHLHELCHETLFLTGDGKTLVRGSGDHVTFWNVETQKPLREFNISEAHTLELSPDGQSFVCCKGNAVSAYDSVSGKKRFELPKSDVDILATGFCAKSNQLFTHASDGSTRSLICTWNLRDGKLVERFEDKEYSSAALSPDGRLVALGKLNGTDLIDLKEMASGKDLLEIVAHRAPVWTAAFANHGSWIVTASSDGVRIWDVKTSKCVNSIAGEEHVVASADGNLIAAPTRSNRVSVWHVADGGEVKTLPIQVSRPRALIFSPDSRRLIIGHAGQEKIAKREPGTLRIWDLERDEMVVETPLYEHTVKSLAISSDGKWIAAAGDDHIVIVNSATGKIVRSIPVPACPHTVVYAGDGRYLACLTMYGGLQVMDAMTGKAQFKINRRLRSLAVSANEQVLITGTDDGVVLVYEMATGREAARVSVTDGSIDAIAISSDGKYVFLGTGDTAGLVMESNYLRWGMSPSTARVEPRRSSCEDLWEQMKDPDPKIGLAAAEAMQIDNNCIDFLNKTIKPLDEATSRSRILELIKSLDDERQDRRESASESLRALGDVADAALEAELSRANSAEVQARIKELLSDETKKARVSLLLEGERLRTLRSIYILEQIGGRNSRELLEKLTKGVSNLRETLEAKRAVERLSK